MLAQFIVAWALGDTRPALDTWAPYDVVAHDVTKAIKELYDEGKLERQGGGKSGNPYEYRRVESPFSVLPPRYRTENRNRCRGRGGRMGRSRLITREKTLADIYRLRAEGLSLRQIEPKLRLAKSTIYDALHPDRAQDARIRKVEAAAQSSSDRRAEALAFWNSVMAKIPDED